MKPTQRCFQPDYLIINADEDPMSKRIAGRLIHTTSSNDLLGVYKRKKFSDRGR